MQTAPNFVCFAPRPVTVELPSLEAALLRRITNLRGFFSTSGIEASTLTALIWKDFQGLTVAKTVRALSRLDSLALIHQVTPGRYVTTKVRHAA